MRSRGESWPESTLRVLPKYAAYEIAFRARVWTLIGYKVEDFPLLSVWGICGGQFATSEALTPKVIEAEIRGDAIDPGIERTLKTKSRQMCIGAKESFLINVLAILLRAG